MASLANVAPKGSEATPQQKTESLQIAPQIIADHPMLAGTITTDIKFNVTVSNLIRPHEHLVGAELTLPSKPSIKKRKDEDESSLIGFGPAAKLQRMLLHSDSDLPEAAQAPAQRASASSKVWSHLLK